MAIRLYHATHVPWRIARAGRIDSSLSLAAKVYFKLREEGISPREALSAIYENTYGISQNSHLRPTVSLTVGEPTKEQYGCYVFGTSVGQLSNFNMGIAKEGPDVVAFIAPQQYCSKSSIELLDRLNQRQFTKIDPANLERFLSESIRTCYVPLSKFDRLLIRRQGAREIELDTATQTAKDAGLDVIMGDYSYPRVELNDEERLLLDTVRRKADHKIAYRVKESSIGPLERCIGNIYEHIRDDHTHADVGDDFFPAYRLTGASQLVAP